MSWVVGAVANGIVAIAYLAISIAIARPLIATKQLLSNRLGAATAAIFLTCAVHHGSHTVHLLLPYVGLEVATGTAMRHAIDVHQAVWDVITAGVGVYYWTLRRTYGALMEGAKLFDDMKERQRRALEINDTIVQGLSVAEMSLRLNETEMTAEAIASTLVKARAIITSLLGETGSAVELGPGDLRRSQAATVRSEPSGRRGRTRHSEVPAAAADTSDTPA